MNCRARLGRARAGRCSQNPELCGEDFLEGGVALSSGRQPVHGDPAGKEPEGSTSQPHSPLCPSSPANEAHLAHQAQGAMMQSMRESRVKGLEDEHGVQTEDDRYKQNSCPPGTSIPWMAQYIIHKTHRYPMLADRCLSGPLEAPGKKHLCPQVGSGKAPKGADGMVHLRSTLSLGTTFSLSLPAEGPGWSQTCRRGQSE